MENKKYATFLQEGDSDTEFEFYEAIKLPEHLPISTPLTFAFIGTDLVLCQKMNKEWDILGGKIDKGEDWVTALKREAEEEAGVEINNIRTVGYFLAKNKSKNNQYPKLSILPVTISFVKKINYDWIPRETIARDIFRKSGVKSVFSKRVDANQILEIYDYIMSIIKTYKFEFILDKSNSFQDDPTTQVMIFCRDNSNNYCIVRDHDEDFFSLPGGGCDLGERDLECAKRELYEEAQIELINPIKIGVIGILMKDGIGVVNRFRHVRFLSECQNLQPFEPRRDNFEIEERLFIPLSELQEKIPLLQNPSGEKIIASLK